MFVCNIVYPDEPGEHMHICQSDAMATPSCAAKINWGLIQDLLSTIQTEAIWIDTHQWWQFLVVCRRVKGGQTFPRRVSHKDEGFEFSGLFAWAGS